MKVSPYSDLRFSDRNGNSMTNPMFSITVEAKNLLKTTRHVALYLLSNTVETKGEVQVSPVQFDFATRICLGDML
jgi:hypothetical protein